MDDVGLGHGDLVHEKDVIANLDRIAAHSGHALQEIQSPIQRELEGDDASPTHRPAGGQVPGSEGNRRAVKKLVEQDVVANQNGAFHRGGGNHRRLSDKDVNQSDGDQGGKHSRYDSPARAFGTKLELLAERDRIAEW